MERTTSSVSHSAHPLLSPVRASSQRRSQDRESRGGKTMQQILVTGGAGHLGRLVVQYLSAAGYRVRGMSRRADPGGDWPGAEWKRADLKTGAGVAEAVAGMELVVHLAAAGNSMVDVEGTRRLLEAAREARVSHLVFISVAGIEKVPWAGGKAKLASEALLEQSSIP